MKLVKARLLILAMLVASCSQGQSDPQNTDWSLLGNGTEMQHHSDLMQINKGTIGKLGLAWMVDMPTTYGLVGNPLIKNGVVFQSGPGGQIFANDLKSGKLLWSFAAKYPEGKTEGESLIGYWGRQFNRGLALYKDIAIVATGDCRLVAVDQKTGRQRWEAQSCDSTQSQQAITGAPRVGEGLVFIGNGCADEGSARGFVDAFDAATGKRKWRFYTVPGDPAKETDSFYKKAAETWGTGWYGKAHGCGSPWDAMTYDEKLHQLIIGVGSASPNVPSLRPADAGDELFTDSVVAVDARTGKYKWHAKQVPHDGWNYEPAVGLMIADLPVNGKIRHAVVSVPKQGFTYVYDAATGKFLSGTKYVNVTWAKGLDKDGRPILDPTGMYWTRPDQTTLSLPGPVGAHNWEALAFNPKSNIVYVPTMIIPTAQKVETGSVAGGTSINWFYADSPEAKVQTSGQVTAIDLANNKVRWQVKTSKQPMNGGLLHTAGGLVFQGLADGRFVAFDEENGKILWSRQTGGAIRAAPSTVMLDGEQYIVLATGNGASASSSTMGANHHYSSTPESRTPPRLLAFKIGAAANYPPLAKPEAAPAPPVPRQDAVLAKRGAVLFEANGCDLCHGTDGGATVGGNVPDLNRTPPASLAVMKQVVQGGALKSGGMPQFKGMSDADVASLFAYIVNGAWDTHDGKAVASSPGAPR